MKRDYLNSKKGLPSEVKKTIIIILVAVILLVGMYFLTTLILSRDVEEEKITENTIQYDEILAGSSFGQSEDEYYVIYYDSTNEYSTVSSLVSSYQLNGGDIKLYSVDLANAINKKYITDGDIVTSDASSLRVKENTLLKFEDGEVSETITDLSEIMDILNS
ncbi:MAG TPA: hypothetical protein IAB59_05080 [Candidatus Onthousia faecipullorum]|uniref:Uncharacterized protein n=1 Tax=Candidatus Onthousia faecipullorum TaxID=2840887 RepID=A0A9D1KB06_9FIRM|nr:hypothetical protein [Candidatus Onthousia faecipullorum]